MHVITSNVVPLLFPTKLIFKHRRPRVARLLALLLLYFDTKSAVSPQGASDTSASFLLQVSTPCLAGAVSPLLGARCFTRTRLRWQRGHCDELSHVAASCPGEIPAGFWGRGQADPTPGARSLLLLLLWGPCSKLGHLHPPPPPRGSSC